MYQPLLIQTPPLDFEQMTSSASRLAAVLRRGDTIALRGDLGAGKTSFARVIIQQIAAEKNMEVTSPTFTLMQSYDVVVNGRPEILWHLDLYRLEETSEAEALGLEELWPHLVLIEWPEIIESVLPEGTLEIAFAFGDTAGERMLTFSGNETWRERLAALT